jgi:hypothetical protein
MLPTLLVILTVAVLYWFPLRSWMGRWGTTSSDLTRVMAGDGLIVDPTFAYTMASTVNAQPEYIWPWLVQMGYQRGGLYSYDWLDRLFGVPSRNMTFALFGVAGPGTKNRVHTELPVGTSSRGKFVVSRTGHTYDVEPDVKSEIPQFSNGLLTYF